MCFPQIRNVFKLVWNYMDDNFSWKTQQWFIGLMEWARSANSGYNIKITNVAIKNFCRLFFLYHLASNREINIEKKEEEESLIKTQNPYNFHQPTKHWSTLITLLGVVEAKEKQKRKKERETLQKNEFNLKNKKIRTTKKKEYKNNSLEYIPY